MFPSPNTTRRQPSHKPQTQVPNRTSSTRAEKNPYVPILPIVPLPPPVAKIPPEWQSYIDDLCNGDTEKIEACTNVLLEKMNSGISAPALELLIHSQLSRPAPRRVVQAATEERARLTSLLDELGRLSPADQEKDSALRVAIERKAASLSDLLAQQTALWSISPPPPSSPPVFQNDTLQRQPDKDQGPKLLAAAGIFLLLLATLLFEGSSSSINGSIRFGVVALLFLALLAAAKYCQGRVRLKAAAPIYTATAAALFPLLLVAAFVFLGLAHHGLTPTLALALGSLAAATLYATLSRLTSLRGYLELSLASLLLAWVSFSTLLPLALRPVGIALFVFVLVIIDNLVRKSSDTGLLSPLKDQRGWHTLAGTFVTTTAFSIIWA